MKTKLFILSLAISLLCSCSNTAPKQDSEAQVQKIDLQDMNLKGKVKQLQENTYRAVEKNGEIQKGDINSSITYIFNDQGNKMEENVYYKGTLYKKITYKYDDTGKMIEENWYNPNGSKITYNCKYDAKGNKIELHVYSTDGNLDMKQTYKYDTKGNKIEMNVYIGDNGSLDSKYTYKYDDKGDKMEENEYRKDGSLDYKCTYKHEYDKNLNWIKQTEYKNGAPNKITEREIEYF
jgi:hypothetical protein